MTDKVIGVLLAGGLARRFGGGDKCLKELAGQTLLAHAIARTRPQVDHLILNAVGDAKRFADTGLEVVADVIADFAGPLAGVLSGMEWAAEHHPDAKWIVTVPTDAPLFPLDLVARLRAAVKEEGADMACAISDGRSHPVFGLWPVRLREDLRRAMIEEDMRKVDRWTARYNIVHVDFATDPVDPFVNINTPEDLEKTAEIMERLDG